MIIILSQACEKLLAHRVDVKLKTHKVADIINRLHVAIPKARDDKVCTLHVCIPFIAVCGMMHLHPCFK